MQTETIGQMSSLPYPQIVQDVRYLVEMGEDPFPTTVRYLKKVPGMKDLAKQLLHPDVVIRTAFAASPTPFQAVMLTREDPIFESIRVLQQRVKSMTAQLGTSVHLQTIYTIYEEIIAHLCEQTIEKRLKWLQHSPKRQALADNSFPKIVFAYLRIENFKRIDALIKTGNVLTEETLGSLFIHQLVEENLTSAITYMAKKGFSLERKDSRGRTPLCLASQKGELATVQTLLSLGAQIEAVDNDKRTPLHAATMVGHSVVVSFLINQGANCQAQSSDGSSLLHHAASYGHTDLMQKLLEALPLELLERGDSDGKTALHCAMWQDPKPEIVRLLIDNGADVNAKNLFGFTPLHLAAQHGHLDSARLILAKGADPLSFNANDDTPFDLALRCGKDDVVRLLLDLSSPTGGTSPVPINPEDLSGSYYRCFEHAFENSQPVEQILYLKKLGDLYLSQGDYVRAAHLINNAYAAAVTYLFEAPYLNFLLIKLKRIEELLLEKLGKKTPADYQNPLEIHRQELQAARNLGRMHIDLKTAPEIIQKEITTHFKKILTHLVEDCITLLGPVPTPFAIMGLGSMSREEMSPYSDLEFAILVKKETEEVLTYFHNLVFLLEIKIINLGETPFPVIRPKRVGKDMTEAKGFTIHGFSKDIGGLAPLGKKGIYQLVGTPLHLASYQNRDWIAVNQAETILANALTSCTFVMGEPRLMRKYIGQVENILSERRRENTLQYREERALNMLQGHLYEFRPLLDEGRVSLRGFDVKKDLYRPIQMIIGMLALYFGLESTSTMVHIEMLRKRGVFSPEGAKRLQSVLSRVLSWRLRTHLHYNEEKEIMYHADNEDDPKARGLLIFSEAEAEELLDIYRALIPLNTISRTFLKGDTTCFANESFQDLALGRTDRSAEKNYQYKVALAAYAQLAALRPDDDKALNDLQRVKLTLDQAEEALSYNVKRLAVLKRKYKNSRQQEGDVADCDESIGKCLSALGRYQESLTHHQQALEIRQNKCGKDSIEVANSYHNIGIVLDSLGKEDESLENLEKALVIRKKILGEKDESVAKSYQAIGSILDYQQKHKKSLKYQLKALTIIQKIYGDKSDEISDCYNTIGLTLTYAQKGDEALEYLKKSLAIRLAIYGENHSCIGGTYNSMGMAYSCMGKCHDALKYYKKGLAICRVVLGNNHPRITHYYTNIGSAFRSMGRFGKAQKYAEKSLLLKQELLEANHPSVALSHSHLGTCYWSAQQFDKALECKKKALDIYVETFGEKDLRVIKLYVDIAANLKGPSKHEEALTYLNKALNLALEEYGDQHEVLGFIYNNMAVALSGAKKFNEALDYDRKALTIRTAKYGERHLETALSYCNMGSALDDLGKYEEALDHKKKALDIWIAAHGETHPDVAYGYNRIGQTLYNLGRIQESLECDQKGLDIWIAAYGGEMHPDVARGYHDIGLTFNQQGKTKESLEYHQKALEIRLRTIGEKHSDTAFNIYCIGERLHRLARYAEAIEFKKRAAAIEEEIYDSKDPTIVDSYASIGASLNEFGKYEEAITYYQKALTARITIFGEEQTIVADTLNTIGNIFYKIGKYDDAMTYFERTFNLRKKLLGTKHAHIANALTSIGNCLLLLKSYEQSLKYHLEASAIRIEVFDKKCLDHASSYHQIAQVLNKLEKHQEALKYVNKALEIRLELLGNDHMETTYSYMEMAISLHGLQKYTEALDYTRKALIVRMKVLNPNSRYLANCLYHVGLNLAMLHSYDEALENHLKALAIREEEFGKTHPDVVESYKKIAFCLESLGKVEEAKTYQKLIDELQLYWIGSASFRKA